MICNATDREGNPCPGDIVIRNDRGHSSAGCNRCHRCVSMETLLGEVDGLTDQVRELRAENEALRALVRRMFTWMAPDPDMGMDAVDECEAIDHEASRLCVVEEP